MAVVVSRYQADKIVHALGECWGKVTVSLDLGLTQSDLELSQGKAEIPENGKVKAEEFEKILDSDICYLIEVGQAKKIQFFLKETNKLYTLLATGLDKAPTAVISGVRMHRLKRRDPWTDTLGKIGQIKPVEGDVLDTCSGLGYTAIAARRAGADSVTTIEADEGMMRLCEINPWSQGLRDKAIKTLAGDSYEVLDSLDEKSFDLAVHDPPSFPLAPTLYTAGYYQKMFQVLKPGARVFHYVGNPGSRYRGKDLPKKTIQKLEKAGYVDVEAVPAELGVKAYKPI